ncbi:beta-1,6-N-acetylglucosaminyltransferase [uncultured Muribaculum sp.]|uniref:beta-1,6-N-acetylglucosaminyltransferase n=1 Tax=uncultured Muribaculum sp. TaxID=1918613 RepID=UPI00261BDB0F|nr:beta-1,6-N-acetylglucosaminyltransferase [uncultured Muribaculum sp.]
MTDRHAYLIMVHADVDHFQYLVNALDDNRNDIYVHVDAKADITLFNWVKTEKARIFFIKDRVDVRWGDPSLISTEYSLFKEAAKIGYKRYHLLSGSDFPLKSQDEIHEYFDSYPDVEFIDIVERNGSLEKELYKKCHLYHFFLPYIKNPHPATAAMFNFIRRGLLFGQMVIRINRKFSFGRLYKGSGWASVTHRFVDELLKHEDTVKKEFKRTHCSDEVYKQTIAVYYGLNISPLGNMRYIDFERGTRQSPYTFCESDFNELKNSKALFARKFSTIKSGRLVLLLKELISKQKISKD